MASVLLTGGAGFIGSHLAARLHADGHHVVVLDNFDPYYDVAIKRANAAALPPDVAVVEGDVRDGALVRRLLAEHRVTRVAHLAALAGVRFSIERGDLYADVNTRGSVILLDAAARHGVETFVLGSTSSIYGQAARVPFHEDDAAVLPLAPYPASKRAAELFAHSYHNLFGLNVTCLRFFNVYGPRGRVDMMPIRTIEAILDGTTIDAYAGGTLQRDWTFIDDIVDGVARALERPLGYRLINLGFGAPLPLSDFIQIYEALIGRRAHVRAVPAPASEPLITFCDNTRARDLLGFAPETPIREGLARTWAWYRAAHGL